MVADCTHQVSNIAGKFEQEGACSYEDAAGDYLYETYRATEPGKGTIAFIGGTGKFAGIRCEGQYWTGGFAKKGAIGVGKKQASARSRRSATYRASARDAERVAEKLLRDGAPACSRAICASPSS